MKVINLKNKFLQEINEKVEFITENLISEKKMLIFDKLEKVKKFSIFCLKKYPFIDFAEI